MRKASPFSPKEAWIKATVTGCTLGGSKPGLHVECGHHLAEDFIAAKPYLYENLEKTECWAKGIINSSGNILVRLAGGGFAPVGKETSKTTLRHGVSVFVAVNDLSRDEPPEYVKSRADAEKLCLLSQVVSPRGWTVAEIAKASGVDCERLRGMAIQNLVRAVLAEIGRCEKCLVMPKLGEAAKLLIG